MKLLQTETQKRSTVLGTGADRALDERDLDGLLRFRHFSISSETHYAVSSSTVLPRLAAISSGECRFASALSVARTML